MVKQNVQDIINQQINAEMYSAYLYLGMAVWCTDQNLNGAAHWFKQQAKEEMGHAMKFYKYLEETGSQIVLKAIEPPPAKWSSLLNVFEEAYQHELKVTAMIYGIVNLAIKEGDHATNSMCRWFVDEQVEEEAQTLEIVNQIKMLGDSKGSLFMLDRQLGKRE
jgi:ferritin